MYCEDDDYFFIGDDLVDIITINRPKNSENITIIMTEVQVGPLKFTTLNPVFPYKISIMRDKCILLDPDNPIHMRVTYNDGKGNTRVRQTCIGHLHLKMNAQAVIDDVEPTPEPTTEPTPEPTEEAINE